MAAVARRPADLVLSGGGVKGVGLVGAVAALIDAGYRPQRVSGTSAGSIIGAVVAAVSKCEDLTGEQVKEIALRINYRKFLDPAGSNAYPSSVQRWRWCGATASTAATTPTSGFALS